jgi:hypothetical protein
MASEAERLEDPFAVQLAEGLTGHLLQDEAEEHRVGVGVVKVGTGIKQRGVLDADLHQLLGRPGPLRVGGTSSRKKTKNPNWLQPQPNDEFPKTLNLARITEF